MRMIAVSALNAGRHVIENSLDGWAMRQSALKPSKENRMFRTDLSFLNIFMTIRLFEQTSFYEKGIK